MSEANESSVNNSRYTLIFMVILSFICALILSVLASALQGPQELAKELDRNKQMLIAARILSPNGYFLMEEPSGQIIPAAFVDNGRLVASKEPISATNDQILDIFKKRIKPILITNEGKITTFEEQHIDEKNYTANYRKTGYYKEPLKLAYKILSNTSSEVKNESKEPSILGYVIPINGMGLWDAIYGYLALKTDGQSVIGISWYDQKETPGLGANIAEAEWQSQFPGKKIFQEASDGKTDFKTATLGLTVVKGRVTDVLGNSPKALSAVDGMAGATLTGNGVTNAYKDVLAAYRPFFIQLQNASSHQQEKGGL